MHIRQSVVFVSPSGEFDRSGEFDQYEDPTAAGLHNVTHVTSRRGAMSLPQLQLSGEIVRNRIIEPRG